VPASQVFNITNSHITGSTLLQGSTANDVTTNYGVSDDVLVKLVAQFRQLLTTAELSPDDREELEADLDALEEEAGSPQPTPQRIRPILRRFKDALVKGALSGLEVAAKQESIDLIDMGQKAITG
jgi:hypothetical protein